jgi:hypothetical protein
VINHILSWRQDDVSYKRIAARLNDEGVPTKRGGQWAAMTVHGLVKRAAA